MGRAFLEGFGRGAESRVGHLLSNWKRRTPHFCRAISGRQPVFDKSAVPQSLICNGNDGSSSSAGPPTRPALIFRVETFASKSRL
jgi:hypothetical protein